MELTEVEKLLIAFYQKREPSADRIGAMHKRKSLPPVTALSLWRVALKNAVGFLRIL